MIGVSETLPVGAKCLIGRCGGEGRMWVWVSVSSC